VLGSQPVGAALYDLEVDAAALDVAAGDGDGEADLATFGRAEVERVVFADEGADGEDLFEGGRHCCVRWCGVGFGSLGWVV